MTYSMEAKRQDNIGKVMEAYGRRLFRFIRGRTRNDADAEDVLQDVWYQLSNVVNLDAIEQVSAWLYRVARNRLTDRSRKKTEQSLEDFQYVDEEGDLYLKNILLPESDTPETAHLRDFFWESLFAALDELPEAQRQVFVWNELEDQTFQEIADRTGENLKTLISRKRYAVQHLRKRLETLYREFYE